MWLFLALAAAGLVGFEIFEAHKATAASQTLRIAPGKVYTLVASVSGAIGTVDPVALLQAVTAPSSWINNKSPFASVGVMPTPGTTGTFLVTVMYSDPSASNLDGKDFQFPVSLPQVLPAATPGSLTLFPPGSIQLLGALES